MSLERILKRMVKGLSPWRHQGSGINYHFRSGFHHQRQFFKVVHDNFVHRNKKVMVFSLYFCIKYDPNEWLNIPFKAVKTKELPLMTFN